MEIMGVVERPMMEYLFPIADGTISSIAKPAVEANNFEIKSTIIQIIRSSVQFSGFPHEDPNKHLVNFLEICDTFKFNGVSNDVVRLRIFPFSLCDTAKDWLQSLPAGSITTWAVLTQKFLAKYFLPAKTAKMLNDITSFVQLDRESLCDAWGRFKSMLRKCPHHGLPVWRQVQTFYNGVTLANRATIDAVAGGTIMKKLPSEAFNIIDEIATNLYSYGQGRADIHSIDAVSALPAQMTALTHKMDNLGAAMWNGAPIGPCGACGQMGHLSQDCKMPSSAKFLKEVLSTKRKWEGGETVKLNEEFSAILQNKLPPKLKDPGGFSIPCTIGNIDFDKVLCDLGASVNLMPYSIFERLGMHELTPSIITLQLADRSIKYPRGIVEDVLEGLFLATGRALIDVQKGQLTLRVNDEHVVFNVFKPMKYLHKKQHDIFAIDSINTFGTDNVHLVKCKDPKEDCIKNSNGDNLQKMNEEQEEVPNFVDTGREVKSKFQTVLLLNGSTSNQKVKPPFEVSSNRKKASEDKCVRPNRMQRRRNQVDENVGFYKEHTKAWNESHMRKKKFKDGDKRFHKNKGPIEVDWQKVKHYIEGAPPPIELSPQLPQITSIFTN
ncbi:UNVERIFIED_CONTAM: hypothetical protein Sradi_3154100 [Sesamum radiatum]|uniref:CCHC-type domain-containing protein n=1 Tax=Sesamum radiatum TaxID=300843 RepID=A0AAW2REA3_SESRA